jgi:integrase
MKENAPTDTKIKSTKGNGPLADKTIINAKPKAKPYRLTDGHVSGLRLLISPIGTKSWQLRYRMPKETATGIVLKAQTATLGKYPDVSLAKARKKAQEARELLAQGKHLTHEKNVAKAQRAAAVSNTFKSVAAAWVADEAQRRNWSQDHKGKVEASLRNHASKLDSLPVTAITALIVSPILRTVEQTAPDIARKVSQRLRSILDSAVERGLIPVNPLPARRRGIKRTVRHYPAVLTAVGVGEILRNAERANACIGVKRAHMLCAFTVQRISEVVGAPWAEFDLEAGTWAIPRKRMKRKDAERGPHHFVPLPPELLRQMCEWRRIDGSRDGWVCPSPATEEHVTREAVEKFYNRTMTLAGIHSPHSWRTVFATWSGDAGKDPAAIDVQQDHAVGNEVQQAYDRAERLNIRRELMTWHEGKLLAARDGAQVITLADRRA